MNFIVAVDVSDERPVPEQMEHKQSSYPGTVLQGYIAGPLPKCTAASSRVARRFV